IPRSRFTHLLVMGASILPPDRGRSPSVAFRPAGRIAIGHCFCAWPCAANRDVCGPSGAVSPAPGRKRSLEFQNATDLVTLEWEIAVRTKISDLHIALEEPLPAPRELHDELPVGETEAAHIARSRSAVRDILLGKDDRLLVVVGPCSIHEPESALDYARRLRDLATAVADALFLVMRVYFEKPRTRTGWKGLIYDPDLTGRGNIREGLRHARGILLDCARCGVPAASEILDLVTPQYYAELLTWGAIGARTTESPLHRQMASALSAPVGFKNPMNGNVAVAVDAILAAAQPHKFPSISLE